MARDGEGYRLSPDHRVPFSRYIYPVRIFFSLSTDMCSGNEIGDEDKSFIRIVKNYVDVEPMVHYNA